MKVKFKFAKLRCMKHAFLFLFLLTVSSSLFAQRYYWLGVVSDYSRQVNECNYMNINEIKRNPVRDYRSVEEGDTTISRMPLGMQPASRNVVAFLTECRCWVWMQFSTKRYSLRE